MNTTITLGYVQVEVPLTDAEGVKRVVCFPRVGNHVSCTPICHWTANRFVREALLAARAALREHKGQLRGL